MRPQLKYLSVTAAMLLACLLCSCDEERYQSVENLCNGYWYRPEEAKAPMIQFDFEGDVYYWLWRYEPDEGVFYAWNDTAMDARYAIDVENSTLCILPDEWYDIYMLSAGILTLSDSQGATVEMSNLPADKVIVLTESEFKAKYPNAE